MTSRLLYHRYLRLERVLYHDRTYTPPLVFKRIQARGIHDTRQKQEQIPNNLTDEQKAIIQYAKYQNVIVTAVPGSGKSTVGLEVLKNNPPGKTLMMTYSKDLQTSTVTKAEQLGIRDYSPILTIHSMAGSLFGRLIRDDYDLRKCLEQASAGSLNPDCHLDFEQVIIDEAQDLHPLYFHFTLILLTMIKKTVGTPPRLLTLGESKQAIFEYNRADARFLTEAEILFGHLSPYSWKRREMTQTHRFGQPIADFVNIQLESGVPRIRGSPSHGQKKPIIKVIDIWEMAHLARQLAPLINEYGPENVAIIAPTIKPMTPPIRLANELSLLGYAIAGAPSDNVNFNSKTSKHKIEVKSVHSYKGKERRLVFYFINGGYFDHCGKGLPDDVIPNDIYVAFTRAQDQLFILHDHTKPLIPTLSQETAELTCEIDDADQLGIKAVYTHRKPSPGIAIPKKAAVEVADLLRSVASDDLFHALGSIRTQRSNDIHAKPKQIWASSDVKSKPFGDLELYEPVSDFIGMAITASFEHAKTGRCTSFGYGVNGNEEIPNVPLEPSKRARWFARGAIRHDSKRHSFIARRRQMDGNSCDWLRDILPKTDQRLGEYIGDTTSGLLFEQLVTSAIEVEGKTLRLMGRIDIVQQPLGGGLPILHEIKFLSGVSRETLLQVAIYGYLWSVTHGVDELPVMKVYNVQDGETWSVESTIKDVESTIRKLIKAKFRYGDKSSDEEFFANCEEVKRKVAIAFDSTDRTEDISVTSVPVLIGGRIKKGRHTSRLRA
ncbi:hypothetical protein FRB91_008755 [Serendipita sp. 411]|nr:hypothetical protein FRB91_008755 [Serendipita sp. 411]